MPKTQLKKLCESVTVAYSSEAYIDLYQLTQALVL